jgi:hypothetical protein
MCVIPFFFEKGIVLMASLPMKKWAIAREPFAPKFDDVSLRLSAWLCSNQLILHKACNCSSIQATSSSKGLSYL